jgi:hypothetical protein
MNTLSARDVLEGDRWKLGFCRGGGARGSYLLLWPLGDGLWDVEFSPATDFDGSKGEEVVAFRVMTNEPCRL